MAAQAAQNRQAIEELDALIVGGGFAGVYQLFRLREQGFKARIHEAGAELGGIWYWNCYPGARVDTDCSLYQFSREDLWRDWNWKELYPSWAELRAYFRYVDRKLDLSKDVRYNTRVLSANFDEGACRWIVKSSDGGTVAARFVILCTGFAAKPFIPDFKGLDSFAGVCHHTGLWPQGGVDFKGKRVGVVGTGCSAVQVIQEASREAAHLTVFQRSPVMAIPMYQQPLDVAIQDVMKEEYTRKFRQRVTTYCGYDYEFIKQSALSVTPEQRLAIYEDLWANGKFLFWLANFEDILSSKEANDTAYAFWRDKVRPRIKDPVLAEKLAPMAAPYPFGCKRVSLEQWYYDLFNQANVDLVDIKEQPIREITPSGVTTAGGDHPLDILVMGTGFDAVTGGIMGIDLRNGSGPSLAEKWRAGVRTFLGLSTAGYPNLFMLYGPQSPSGWSNGPTTAELQGDMVIRILEDLRQRGLTRIEATSAAEEAWRQHNAELANQTLIPSVDSWYTGSNVPGKPREILNYPGGLPTYSEKFRESADNNYAGFTLA